MSEERMPALPADWQLVIRVHSWLEIHGPRFAEAICAHGVGHHKGVHGCDGCCVDCPPEIWAKVSKD